MALLSVLVMWQLVFPRASDPKESAEEASAPGGTGSQKSYTIFSVTINLLEGVTRSSLKIRESALASVAQWIECQPANPKGSPVRFPVRAHAWPATQAPSSGAQEATTP